MKFQTPEIKISNNSISDSVIGEIYLANKIQEIPVNILFKYGKQEIISLNYELEDIAVTSDHNIFSTDGERLLMLDNKFKLIREFKPENFNPKKIAINEEDRLVYATDCDSSKILMVDFHFNFLKSSNHEVSYPRGICSNNGLVYICDSFRKRIQIFTKNLVFNKSLKLHYEAFQIVASNSFLCISSLSTINFYNINTLLLSRTFNLTNSCIFETKSAFYAINNELYITLYCFDWKGCLDDKIVLNDSIPYTDDGPIECKFVGFNDRLLLLGGCETGMISFS